MPGGELIHLQIAAAEASAAIAATCSVIATACRRLTSSFNVITSSWFIDHSASNLCDQQHTTFKDAMMLSLWVTAAAWWKIGDFCEMMDCHHHHHHHHYHEQKQQQQHYYQNHYH
jgi:hypothetical protein